MNNKVLYITTMDMGNLTQEILLYSYSYFDKVNIVDGDFKEETIDKYTKVIGYNSFITEQSYKENMRVFSFDKVNIIDRKWDDSLAGAYSTGVNCFTKEGDWILVMDDDEFPGTKLLQNFDGIVKEAEEKSYDAICLPVVDYLEGKALWSEDEVPQEFQKGMWFKCNLIRKGKEDIEFMFSGTPEKNTHAIVKTNSACYYPYPYLHKKIVYDFMRTEALQMFQCGAGQMVDFTSVKLFEMCCKRAGYKSSLDLDKAIKEGKLLPDMKALIFKYRNYKREGGDLHPLAALYGRYYYFEENDEIAPSGCTLSREYYIDYITNWKEQNKTYRKF